jgi:hypothetical protein
MPVRAEPRWRTVLRRWASPPETVEVAEPDVVQAAQCPYGGGGDGVVEAGQDGDEVGDLHGGVVGDGVGADPGGQGGGVEAGAAAAGAYAFGDEFLDGAAGAFGQGGGVAFEVEAGEPVGDAFVVDLVEGAVLAVDVDGEAAAVQEQVAFGGGVVGDGLGGVERAGAGVDLPLPGADAEQGEADGAVVERAAGVDEGVEVELDGAAEAVAAGAHAGGVVEGVGEGVAGAGGAVAGEQHAQDRHDVGHRADGGAGVAADGFLVDDDGGAEVVDGFDVGFVVGGEPVADEGGVGLVELALRFGGDGVEDDGGLAGAGHAGEDDQAVLGDAQGDVLEVVDARAGDHDAVVHAATLPYGVRHSVRPELPRGPV